MNIFYYIGAIPIFNYKNNQSDNRYYSYID